jgi:hypothetical protein
VTISLAPRTLNSIADPRLQQLRKALIGSEVVDVAYAMPPEAIWPHGHRSDAHVHEVDMGVDLSLGNGTTLRLLWATPGSDEGLAIELLDSQTVTKDDLIDSVNVASRGEWADITHHPIKSVGIAFYSYDGSAEDRPWSFRLEFANGMSVVFALGEVADDQLSYMPDSLVVIFDEAMARAYEVAEARSSAWGEMLNG